MSEEPRPPEPEPGYAMRSYVLAFLHAGPTQVEDPERKKALQQAHLEHIGRLADEGKLILAGPFLDSGDLRGLFLLDTERVEEAKEWCDSDPAVVAGALRVELKPWFSARGITIDQPAATKAREARAAREASKPRRSEGA